MPVLNPFLRALFQSSVLGHALASQNYVLLVPTSESLFNGTDRENGRLYAELVDDEDFLGSHILRTPPTEAGPKEINLRDSRGKAKTYSTVNNRTVIIKENTVYGSKGFKQMTHAQLLSDSLYYSPLQDLQQWLVVYISKPLLGTYERTTTPVPILGARLQNPETTPSGTEAILQPQKKDIQSFNDLLNYFPMIAKQMQPGLERLFNEFGKELGKPLPPPPSVSTYVAPLGPASDSVGDENTQSNGLTKLPFHSAAYFEDEEDLMRTALETAITAGIDLFQGVDKQQLSLLGATTDLTGPAVERLIERYVTESVHDNLVFPRLCAFHRAADHDLDRRIRQMECLDVSQVGIVVEDGKDAKRELLVRIDRGVTAFRKMGIAGSSQQMLEILLETQKAVSEPWTTSDEEKKVAAMTINADILVSLLLLVVIRSQVRHLQARLFYMQRFVYIDDVESGEIGYALSTLEAVLTYLSVDAGGLRRASKQNSKLWNAVKQGNVPEIRSIFDGSSEIAVFEEPEQMTDMSSLRPPLSRTTTRSSLSLVPIADETDTRGSTEHGNLGHVYPFQISNDSTLAQNKRKKKVHLEARSMSISSSISIISRTATIESTLSGIEGDISIQSLAQTQDVTGNSVLMIAVESQQPRSLRYLLGLSEHYSPITIVDDLTSEGTTLLSAAVQLANVELIDILLDYLETNVDFYTMKTYLARPDSRGRTCAHYIFNAPRLISRLASRLPWRLKDKIGHTPLFAICRTYDHVDYSTMVSDALVAAKNAQNDGRALDLHDHIDYKGNTILHIINDPTILVRVLKHCDADPNAMNDKRFTPLMLASKYGRVDMVRVFFGDPRVDLYLREARGLTAVELAKDDEVRNRIDDLTLFSASSTSQSQDPTGRITSIVRSFFVEDGSTRYVVKSGAPNMAVSSTTYTITTSRRSLQDFANLARWLSADHPASYVPQISPLSFRSPFQIHSRPSKAVLHDIQIHLDRFLKNLISHPTFSTHEMLWEFFIVPDMQPDQIEARSRLKTEYLQEKIADDYEPLVSKTELDGVDLVITHARDLVKKVNVHTRSIIRRGHVYNQSCMDAAEAVSLLSSVLSTTGPPSTTLPSTHVEAFVRMSALVQIEPASLPLPSYISALTSLQTTNTAVQAALSRPSSLVYQIRAAQKGLARNRNALANSNGPRKGPLGFNLPGSEESRLRLVKDTERQIVDMQNEVERKGRELRYTQEVVVGELAGWTTWRGEWGRNEIRRFAQNTVIKEKERLKGMQRVLKSLQSMKNNNDDDVNLGGAKVDTTTDGGGEDGDSRVEMNTTSNPVTGLDASRSNGNGNGNDGGRGDDVGGTRL